MVRIAWDFLGFLGFQLLLDPKALSVVSCACSRVMPSSAIQRHKHGHEEHEHHFPNPFNPCYFVCRASIMRFSGAEGVINSEIISALSSQQPHVQPSLHELDTPINSGFQTTAVYPEEWNLE